MSPAFYSMFICFHVIICSQIYVCVYIYVYLYLYLAIYNENYLMILKYFELALGLMNIIHLWYVLRACKIFWLHSKVSGYGTDILPKFGIMLSP